MITFTRKRTARAWTAPAALVLMAASMAMGPADGAGPADDAAPPAGGGAEVLPAWHGSWEGRCRAVTPEGRINEFAMALRIAPAGEAGRLLWTIIYGEGGEQQERPYELVVVDASKGHYRIDEKNSVVLDAYLIGETLHSWFSLDGTMIHAAYALQGDALVFSLASGDLAEPRRTGGGEGVPEVSSYRIDMSQRAVLYAAKRPEPPGGGDAAGNRPGVAVEGDGAMTFRKIGVIRSPYTPEKGAPRQGAFAPEEEATIVLDAEYAAGLQDIETFTHVVVLYAFDRSKGWSPVVKTPWEDKPHGVFATRAPRRPNPIGMTVVRLVKREGATLFVKGLDAFDGTAVLDLKPYVPRFDRIDEAGGGWLGGEKK